MRGGQRQDGYILVAVLAVMLVLSSLVASSSLFAHSMLRAVRTDTAMNRLDGLLRGGLEMTAYQIVTLKLPPTAVSGRALRFGPGSVTPYVADEAGRIDVNGADPALLEGALRAAGLDAGTVSDVMSRVAIARGKAAQDANQEPQAVGASTSSGESSSGTRAKPGTAQNSDIQGVADATKQGSPGTPDATASPPRTGFRSVAEFLAFARIDRDSAVALAGVLTVMNPDGKLNALTATRQALLALPKMSEVAVDAFMAERRSALPSSLATLKGTLANQKNYVKFEAGPCYRVHLVSKDTQGRSASREAVIAAGTGPSDPFYILDWE